MEKIPLIRPLNVGNKLLTDFKEKARLFNKLFASKCTPITNDSSLPSLLNLNLTSNLSVINFTDDDILKIIISLNINKAHGHDDISIRMIIICDTKTSVPGCNTKTLVPGTFPDSWKKYIIVPMHKKITDQFFCYL